MGVYKFILRIYHICNELELYWKNGQYILLDDQKSLYNFYRECNRKPHKLVGQLMVEQIIITSN